jgi:hypothetical protein
MRNKDNIKELINYFQSIERNTFQYDENAMVTTSNKNSYQPLSIKILSVLGGLLACAVFVSFLFMIKIYNSAFSALILGVFCIISSIWINKRFDKIIFDTLSVSFFLIGFVLLGISLDKFNANATMISAVFIVIALILLRISQNYIQSFVSILIIHGSILTLILFNKFYDGLYVYIAVLALIFSYLNLKEAKIITSNKIFTKIYNPIRVGLVFSFLSVLIYINLSTIQSNPFIYFWIDSLLMIIVVLYVANLLLEKMNVTNLLSKSTIIGLIAITLLPTILSPAIAGCILIILLSFWVNHKTGLIIGIIALIYFIAQYYYDLHFTLLTKSILLFSSGVLFLFLYYIVHKKLDTI